MSSAVPILLYFDGPGKAELARLAFAAGDVYFVDQRVPYPMTELEADPKSLPNQRFGSVPILKHGSFVLAQSVAIAQYAADLGGLTSTLTPQQRAVDLQYVGAYVDMQDACYKFIFGEDAAKAKAKETLDELLSRFLPALERMIPEKGFINGLSHVTLADLAIYDIVESPMPSIVKLGYSISSYPKLSALVARVAALPGIVAHKAGLPKYKLSYFAGKGLGETSRLLFAAAGVKFEDKRYPIAFKGPGQVEYPEFLADESTFPQGQLPVLTVTCGKGEMSIGQSRAIERFLATTFGLISTCPAMRAIEDSVSEAILDLRQKFWTAKTDAEKTEYFNETMPFILKNVEKYIGENGTFGADGIVLADIQMFCTLSGGYKTPFGDSQAACDAVLAKFPKFLTLIKKVGEQPGIAKWIAGRPERGDLF